MVLVIQRESKAAYKITEKIELSGYLATLYEYNETKNQAKIDLKANIMTSLKLSNETRLGIEYFGKHGQENPIEMFLKYKKNNQEIVFGNYEIPFGTEADRVSNFADCTRHTGIVNSALQTFLSGDRSPLGTLGLYTQVETDKGSVALSFSNGTLGYLKWKEKSNITALRYISQKKKGVLYSTSLISGEDEGRLTGAIAEIECEYKGNTTRLNHARMTVNNKAMQTSFLSLERNYKKLTFLTSMQYLESEDLFTDKSPAIFLEPQTRTYQRYTVSTKYKWDDTKTLKAEIIREDDQKQVGKTGYLIYMVVEV